MRVAVTGLTKITYCSSERTVCITGALMPAISVHPGALMVGTGTEKSHIVVSLTQSRTNMHDGDIACALLGSFVDAWCTIYNKVVVRAT